MSGAVATLTPRTDADVVEMYERRNLPFIVWPSEYGKGPREARWTEKRHRAADWLPGMNVGIFTGTKVESGGHLAAVDFDWPPGVGMARSILPETGFGIGRPSKSPSQAFYTTPNPEVSKRFEDPENGAPFVELRGTKTDGTIGLQSMVAPSVHPSGERVELVMDGEIGHADDLPRRVALYATACILFKYLGLRGLQHDVRLAVAGFLLRLGLADAEVILVSRAVAKQTGNDAADVAPSVRDTARKMREGERVTGARAVERAIGDHGKQVVARIREWFPAESGGDVIVMEGGKLSEIVDRAEAALIAAGRPIYQRGGVLVRPVTLDVAKGDTIRRSPGNVVLVGVNDSWLAEEMGRSARWVRGHHPADPQALYARTLVHRGEWRFPVLRSLQSAPTLARDGRVIEKAGFDADSDLLLTFTPDAFSRVPQSPMRDEARAALARFLLPFRGFPFVDEAAKSVVVAAYLTALVRPSLRTSPLFVFDASVAGSGKSILVEGVGLLASGVKPAAMSQGKTAEEDEKRLATVLFAGDSVVHLDNCERVIAGDFLCSALSQEVVQARVLGLSERRIIPSTAVILASGNNVTLAGDVCRRAVVGRLDPQMERPDTRVFDFDFHAELLAHRHELVVAGLTVLRAYAVAGFPERLTPMGSFDDFGWIRGALVWLGMADPADTRQAVLENDPRRDEFVEVLGLWRAALGGEAVEVSDIARRAESGASGFSEGVVTLHDKLTEVACRGAWNARSVGWWLRRHKDRVNGGHCFRQAPGRSGQRWSVASVGDAAAVDLPFAAE